MSDLGPFVAAALKDKTIMELQAELRKKDDIIKELKQAFFIGITAFMERPVYAEGHFEKGEKVLNCEYWRVPLRCCLDCPLERFRNVEVWIGHVMQFLIDSEDDDDKRVKIEVDFRGAKHEYKGGKDVLITNGDIRILAIIYGWKRADWHPFLAAGGPTWEIDADLALEYFESIPYRETCHVRFEAIEFDASAYMSMIDRAETTCS